MQVKLGTTLASSTTSKTTRSSPSSVILKATKVDILTMKTAMNYIRKPKPGLWFVFTSKTSNNKGIGI